MFKTIVTIIIAALLVVSCGEPNNPEDYTGGYKIVKKVVTHGDANDVVVDGNYAYIAQGEGGLAIIDISNPSNALLVKNVSGLDGYSTKLVKKDNVVFLAAGTSGFNRVEVSDPSNPNGIPQDINGKLVNLHLMGNYLATSLSERGFNFYFIRDGFKPVDRRRSYPVNTDGFTNGITTTMDESKLFAATGEMGLSLYDISIFDLGYGDYPLMSKVDLPGYAESVVLDDSKNIAYVACGNKGIQVVDYSDSSNMKIIGFYDTAGYVKEIIFENNKLYITASGLQVFDVSTPSNPKILGIVDTEYALGVTIDENYIYVADKEEGLIIIGKK